MKSKFKIALAAGLATVSLMATAGAASYDHCADRLKDLGLFQGTAQGYELDRAPTRAEAATMLVRLLGKEAEAKELKYTAPFTDLDAWQQPYVQYLYDNGLTTGATATTFEPEAACSAQMYTTFLLRALGYSDKAGADFTYAQAVSFGETVGLVDYANCSEKNFLRDHVAAMSLTALNTDVKGAEDTVLLEKLVQDGAVEKAKADDLLAFFDRYDAYEAASADMSRETKMDMTIDLAAEVKMDGTQLMAISLPLQMQMDMNLEQMDQSKIAMTGTASMKINEELVGEQPDASLENQKIEYYYTDGVYYMSFAGEKYKMEMSFEDMMAQMGDLTSMQTSEPLCLIESIEQAGNDTTVTYSAAGMNGLVNTVLGNMGMDLETLGVDMSFEDITCKVVVSNGAIKSMDVAMQMDMSAEGQTLSMGIDMDCTINQMGSGVTVKLPSDLDTYQDLLGGTDAPAA